jgi:spoIIIJ-associated protein
MEAMSPAERRIVHSYLQDVNGVTTHSEGVEPNRCVVVTPEEKK